MKRCLFFIYLLRFSVVLSAQDIPNLPIPIGAGTAEVWNDEIYFFGGSDSYAGTTIHPRVYKFDGATWYHYDNIPDNRLWGVRSVLVDDCVYLLGGWPQGERLLRRYDLKEKNWIYLAYSPNTLTTLFAIEYLDGFIYLFNYQDAYRYTIANDTWNTITPKTDPARVDLNSVVYQGEIYVLGYSHSAFYKYTPSTDTWTILAHSPYQVGACAMCVKDENIYCIGGSSSGHEIADIRSVMIYNIPTDTWTIHSFQISGCRNWMAIAEYKNNSYVLGGFDSTSYATSKVEKIPTVVGESIPDLHTIGLWHFNENSCDKAFDSSGNGLHGTLENGASWDSYGKFGSCISFTGNYQRVFVPDDPILDIRNELTIDAWIYLLPTNNRSVIFNKYNSCDATPPGQYCFNITLDNFLEFWTGDNYQTYFITTDFEINFNEWMLVSAVFDHGSMGIFINGNQVAFGQAPFNSLITDDYLNDDLYIGDALTDDYDPYSFDGKIDEVRISNISRYTLDTLTNVDIKFQSFIPEQINLYQNYPNPFNPVTTIKYQLPKANEVTIKIYNMKGQLVKTLINQRQSAGYQSVNWNGIDDAGKPVTSGVYIYQLQTEDFVQTRKMVLVQ